MTDLLERLTAACVDLTYQSEGEEPIAPFVMPGPFSIEALLKHHGKMTVEPATIFNELLADSSKHPAVTDASRTKAKKLQAAIKELLSEPFVFMFGGRREVPLIGGKTGESWTAIAPCLDISSELENEQRPQIESVEPPRQLVEITSGLAVCEREYDRTRLRTKEPLWSIASTKDRATIVDAALAGTGFIHVKPGTTLEEQEDDSFKPLIAIFAELTNVRTYFAGWSATWDLYIVGETSDGKIAGVATLTVMT